MFEIVMFKDNLKSNYNALEFLCFGLFFFVLHCFEIGWEPSAIEETQCMSWVWEGRKHLMSFSFLLFLLLFTIFVH